MNFEEELYNFAINKAKPFMKDNDLKKIYFSFNNRRLEWGFDKE